MNYTKIEELEKRSNKKSSMSDSRIDICHVCNESAIVFPVERLSNNGIVMKAVHSDAKKTIHKWAEYKSIFDIGRGKGRNPIKIKCPSCGKIGRINEYKPDLKKKPEVVAYYVAHEKLKGTWGKNKTVSKLRRCYIKDPKQRDIILKKLGRYIERE